MFVTKAIANGRACRSCNCAGARERIADVQHICESHHHHLIGCLPDINISRAIHSSIIKCGLLLQGHEHLRAHSQHRCSDDHFQSYAIMDDIQIKGALDSRHMCVQMSARTTPKKACQQPRYILSRPVLHAANCSWQFCSDMLLCSSFLTAGRQKQTSSGLAMREIISNRSCERTLAYSTLRL